MPKTTLNRARYADAVKVSALYYYSQGSMKCARCKFEDWRALCLDHINGGGHIHRREKGVGSIFQWVVLHNYPPNFQVLCANCNLIKAIENREWRAQ